MSIASNSVRKEISKKSPSKELSEDAKNAISVIKGLIKTRKQITTVKDIEREYLEMEGQKIPFKKLGFNSLDQLMRASGDFHLSNNNGEVLISLKLSKNNESIASMIQSKSKKPLLTKRYIPRNPESASSSNNSNWRSPPKGSNNNSTNNSNGKAKRDDSKDNGKPDLREVLNRRSTGDQKPPAGQSEYRSASLLMRQISKPSVTPTTDSNNNAVPDQASNKAPVAVRSTSVIKASAPPFIPQSVAAPPTKIKIEHPSKRSVNHRLKINAPIFAAADDSPSPQSEISDLSSSSIRSPTPPPIHEANNEGSSSINGDLIGELESLCETLNIKDLKYDLFRKDKTVACRVTVNNIAYYASPGECRTEDEAKLVATQNALDALRIQLERKNYPICSDDDYTLAGMIYEMLRTYSQGVVEKVIPEYFQQSYGMSLPDHWTAIIGSYSKFFTVESASGCFIVFANEDAFSTSDSGVGGSPGGPTTTTGENGSSSAEKLGLPWNEKYWNLYVSNPATTTTVWARIIGDEYSNRMDAMMTDIELCMISDQKKAKVIELRKVYLVTASSCWYRVRCQQMDFENSRALCFFIDIGEEEWFPLDQLFVCEPKFLELPPQVLMFSLYGLEGFEDNPHAKPHLEKILAGKTVVAEVISRREDYDESQKIKALLFDTSGEEDLNLVEQLLTDICAATPPPQLERAGVTHVTISHISDDGDVYCQIRNSGIGYIKKLIDSVVANREALDRHRGLKDSPTTSYDGPHRYLVFDRLSTSWFRATVEEKRSLNKEHKMMCIDFGCSKVVAERDIYLIEPLSMALSKYPPLAVKCRLYNIPPVNENVVARMKGLLTSDSATLVKMTVQGSVPQVNIYKRLETNNIMFCVNETLRMEQELEGMEISSLIKSDTNDSNNNTVKPLSGASSGGVAVAAQSMKGKNLALLKDIPLPSVNSFFNVFVTLASNPFNFVVQPYDQRVDFHEMMRKLQAYCVHNNEFLTLECVEINQYYAAQHADGKWLRASVERMFDGSIHVSFCDYGEIAVLGVDKLKMLPAEYRTLPKQAMKCRLYGIEPIHKDWTTHDCVKFNKLTVDKRFVSVIKGIRPDDFFANEKIIELVLIDTTSEVDVNVNEVLKNEGRAIACNQA